MDNFGDVILGIGVLLTLASFGIATFAAFALMAALGLVTELSFKRIFFISFGVALFVPVLFGGALVGALSDEENQAAISDSLRETLPSTERLAEELGDLAPVTADELRELEDGTLTEEELERRIEERVGRLFPGTDVEIDDNGIRISTSDNGVVIDTTPGDGVVIDASPQPEIGPEEGQEEGQ